MKNHSLYPFAIMENDPYGLDRYELFFRWGNYGFRVLHCHLASFEPGEVVGTHKHSTFEFHFIADGKGTVDIEGKSFNLHDGMFYLTGPDVLHRQVSDAMHPMKELCLHLDILQSTMDHQTSIATDEAWNWESNIERKEADNCVQELRRLPLYPTEDTYQAMSWFLSAYRSWLDGDPFFHTTYKQAVIQICMRAVRAYRKESPEIPIPAREMNTYRYELATQFIRDNYSLPLTLEEVAGKVFISGRQLQRIFKEIGRCSFRDYLESVRLTHIRNQLMDDDSPIEIIAKRHGFDNSNYLYTVFKKKYGMTPGEFRKFIRMRKEQM